MAEYHMLSDMDILEFCSQPIHFARDPKCQSGIDVTAKQCCSKRHDNA